MSIATQTGEDSASPVKADKDGEKDQSEPSKSTVELIDHPKQQAKNPQVEIVTGQSQSQESSKTAALTTKRNKKLSLEDLKAQVETLEELLKFLEKEYGKLRAKVIRFKSRGVIDYKTMWAIFPPGSRVVIEDEDSGEPTAIEVTETEYLNSHMRGKRFSISGMLLNLRHILLGFLNNECTGTQIQWQGSKFVKTTESAEIKSFRGQRTLSSLKVEPLSDAKKAELTARGRKYVTYAGSYYMQYEGDLIMVHFSEFTGKKSIVRESARGRVMVDRESYKILNPSGYGVRSEDSGMECDCASCIANTEFDLEADRYASGEDTSEDEDEEDQGIPIVAPSAPKPTRTIEKDGVEVVRLHEDELCLLPPCHFGFSFALRAWGQMLVTYEPIKFDDEAFDHLVMDEVPKTAIKSLVDSTRKENCKSRFL